MVTSAGARFTLKRVTDTLKAIFKNKMAVIGLILLTGFLVAALAAPFLSPYSPTQTVSGNLAQPEWVSNFPDGYYLSKNMVIPTTGTFTSPASTQAWTLSASPATLANIQESYAPGLNYTAASNGSLQLTYSGSRPGTARISETFQFPYRGPPSRFIADIHYMLRQADASTPINVKVFIERVQDQGVQDYYLVNENESISNQWLPSASSAIPAFDSQTQALG